MEFPIKVEYESDEEEAMIEELNGICLFVKLHGWHKGWRNNLSVNVCICQNKMNLDEEDPFWYWLKQIYNENAAADYQKRKDIIDTYVDSWNGLWSNGFDVNSYIEIYKKQKKLFGDDANELITPVKKTEEESNKEEN